MFTRRVPLPDLIDFCRVLRLQLGAGMTVQEVMKKQSDRGRNSVRAIAGRVSVAIRNGDSLSSAIDKERDAFPRLFRSMVKLGETTGHSAETFGELERYYQLELQLRRQFRNQTFFPIVQFVFAVALIAGLVYLLGVLNPQQPMLTVFGLGGAAGALAFLGAVATVLAAIWLVYYVIARLGRHKKWMDRLLLRIPAVGPCLYALVMSRFTLALRLTLDSGIPIAQALRISLDATGNAYFAAQSDRIERILKNGKPLLKALESSGLFTSDFLDMVASSEAAGSVPEMMRTLGQQYQEEAGRKLTALIGFAGGFVWVCVAAFMIWAIFRLAFIYFGMFDAFRR